ncbi:MAG: prepilin-type N-terminal cleavage/methylation domain-containing protein [Oscillospiraceae bacterium]|nr:prepilin-type N-terminal cleavage/methylation domain-containing protein [Oscillospiraceae bacterium]
MKRFKRLLNKKGFTLVELIVSVGILGILMLMMMVLFNPINRMITSSRRDAHMDTMLENYVDFIRRNVDTAERLEIFNFTETANTTLDPAVNAALTDFSSRGADFETYALYIDPNGQLYAIEDNLTPITSLDVSAIRTRINDNNRVFLPPYYNGCTLRHRFYVFGEGGLQGGLQVWSMALRGGEQVTFGDFTNAAGHRVTSFNLINPMLSAISLDPVSMGAEDFITNQTTGVLILYSMQNMSGFS